MQALLENQIQSPSFTQLQSQKILKAQKIDYRQKNLDHIQKLKQKKQKQQEQKEKELKKGQDKKEKLKKKILMEAQRVREQKEKENSKAKQDIELPVLVQKSKRVVCESLPKQCPEGNNKEKFKKRHSDFLNSLSQGIKTKKELQQTQKKKKQDQYERLKQEMGINKISSKLTKMLQDEQEKRQVRSVSLQGNTQDKSPCIEPVYNATSKGFQDKYSEYIENIKKKKVEKQLEQQQKEKKFEKRKQKLKDYVLTTVKKNVLDGVYEDEEDEKDEKKKQLKRKISVLGEEEEIEEQDDEESGGDGESQQKPKKKRRKMRNFPHVVDLAEWKKKNRLDPETQVFIVTGGYSGIKKALYARGWVQNPDPTSPCFNLKWVLQSRQCQYNSLQQDQVVNHFQKNGAITTKIGLSKNLRGMKWVTNVDLDEFFPKCFDMCDDQDLQAFEEEFKICKAITILKLHMKLASLKNMQELQKIQERVKVAYCILERSIISLDELIDKKKVTQSISKKEWEIMAEDELNTEGLAKKKHQQWLMSINLKYNDTKEKKKKQKKKKKSKETEKQQQEDKQQQEQEKYDQFTEQINQLLSQYQAKYPQYSLTNTHNIWILKPAGLSRGRGIICFNNLVQILDHIKSKQSQWIAQKYIQNPLIVHKRKFDIRLWVLVTSFNPLIIWKFDQCYIRFSALDYNVQDVGNKFIHLTNNSIAALHKNFDKSEIKGNMFSQQQFSNYLKDRQGYDIFDQKIKGQMINIIEWSMMAGQEHIDHRKNSHQLYGYDFMIDEDYKVWLIEINSSPSMDFSTHITTRLVKTCLDDVVKVVVDYNDAPKKEKKKVDTGAFKLIYKGTEISDKHITTGLNLGIEGVQLKKGKKVQNKNIVKDNKNI